MKILSGILIALCLLLIILQINSVADKKSSSTSKNNAANIKAIDFKKEYSYKITVEEITIKITSTRDRYTNGKKVAGCFVVLVGNKKFVNPQKGKIYKAGTIKFNSLPNDVFEIINSKCESVDISVLPSNKKDLKTNMWINNKPVRYEYVPKGDTGSGYFYFYNKRSRTHLFEICQSLEKKPTDFPPLFKACVLSFTITGDN